MVGDADGVVVVPGEHLDTVLQQAAARTEKEKAMFEALRGGTTTVKLLELDTTAVRVGDDD
jgi:regulator of RNase E activity RraA